MRHISIAILIILSYSVFSCKDNVVCPAYQSTFILNDSIRMAKYSMFRLDSMPKYQVASRRNKYGVAKSYGLFERQRKSYDLMTSPKVNVLGPPALDTMYAVDEIVIIPTDTISIIDSLSVSQFPTDSTAQDSLEIAPPMTVASAASVQAVDNRPKYKYRYKTKNPYNHDQEYYNKYYGKLFIDNRPPPVKKIDMSSVMDSSSELDSLGQKKKRSFIPKFFSKKKKQKEAESEQELEEDLIEEVGEIEEEEEEDN